MRVIKRYKEIIFGVLLGVTMWVLDAAMHAQLGTELHSQGFFSELFHSGPTQLVFRVFYVLISTAFGWYLWRSNWRERELRALEDAIIAFHRQLDSPAMRILSQSKILQGYQSVVLDVAVMKTVQSIGEDARLIDELAKRYLHFSQQVTAGNTTEAIETLQAIESWAAGKHAIAATNTSDSTT